MTTTVLNDPAASSPEPRKAAKPALDSMLDQTLHTSDDFWIQIVPSDPDGTSEGVYLSTFQGGSAQHVTTLTPREARSLGERLIRLSWEVDAAA